MKLDRLYLILITEQNLKFAAVFFAPYFVSLLGNTKVFPAQSSSSDAKNPRRSV